LNSHPITPGERLVKQKIVFVVYNPDSGGAVNATTKRQAEYLANLGFDVTLFANTESPNWAGVSHQFVAAIDTKFWLFLDYVFVRFTNRLPGFLKAKFDMHRVIPQMRFPVSAAKHIQKHPNFENVALCIACQHASALGLGTLRKNAGITFFLVAHGDIFEHPTESFSVPMRFLYRHSAKKAYRSADKVIAVSKAIAARALKCGASTSNVIVIHHGIDIPEPQGFLRNQSKSRSGLKLLFVGRLAPEKGLTYLVESLSILEDKSLHLTIIGDGPLLNKLKQEAGGFGVIQQIEFTGHMPPEHLESYYKRADVLVLPSLSEAFGLVILEAQSYGLPVIATQVGGIPDLIKDGHNGILVEAASSTSLAHAIKRMLDQKALISEMGINAFENSKIFSWENSLSSFAELVSEVFRVAPELECK